MGDPPSAPTRILDARWLGRVPYGEALALQERLVVDRREGKVEDTLLLLEHPHVITLGTSSRPEHVLADADERAARSIELFETGRGGDVTYHGPGQLVGYPILDLKPDRKDIHRYLRDLEEVLIRVAASFGVEARRVPGLTGVWAGEGKVAALGVRVSSGWITSHGFALNVDTDLRYFGTIVPCGIADREVTSLSRLTGRPVSLEEAHRVVVEHFSDVFGCTIL
ncbi:MAG: octanoyltransferase [Gemmatimonadota bacterium]